MFRKLNLKTLSIVFVVLLALVIITYFVDKSKGTNTLISSLYEVNANDVTTVVLSPKATDGHEIMLQKDGDNWNVVSDGKTYNGDIHVIENLISSVNKLKPLRLAAQHKEQWNKYDLTDSLCSTVKLMNGNNELARLYIGKFSYIQTKQNVQMQQQNPYAQQPRGTMTTYVRSNNDDEVYAVEGFLGRLVNQKANAFRNKQIVKVNSAKLNKITFSFPADSSFTLVKNEDKWMCDGEAADSVSVTKYLKGIANLKGSSFAIGKPSNYTYKVTIEGDGSPVEINAALDGENAIITSSQNPGTIINDKKMNKFKKLFISKQSLYKTTVKR